VLGMPEKGLLAAASGLITTGDRLAKALGSLADATNRHAAAVEEQNQLILAPSKDWSTLR
jgi:hypothetical protein